MLSEHSRPASDRPASRQSEIVASCPVGEIIHYHCAVAVAEELHFTRAARRLNLDQSAVSRHVQKLESVLAVKLFVRGPRGIALTEAGRAFVPRARKALIHANDAVAVARAVGRGQPQVLQVIYSTLVDIHLIAQIKRLVEQRPLEVPVRFRSVAPDRLVETLLEGSSHMGISILPVEQELFQGCLLREEIFVALPNLHRLTEEERIGIAQLGNEPVIWAIGSLHSAVAQRVLESFRNAGYVPNVTGEAQSVAEALASVREGFGVTFIKSSELGLNPEGVVVRQLAESSVFVQTGLLTIAERDWAPLRELTDLLVRTFPCDCLPDECPRKQS